MAAERLPNERANDATPEVVFTAALTLLAILIGVIGIFKVEIGQLEERGLSYLAAEQSYALYAATAFFIVSAWSAFFSFLAMSGAKIATWLHLFPLGIATFALLLAVPAWVWFL